MKLMLHAIAITVAVAFTTWQPVLAQAPAGTLAKIKDSGEIAFGHRDSSIPFSYLDDQQKPIGFAMDRRMLLGIRDRAERVAPPLGHVHP